MDKSNKSSIQDVEKDASNDQAYFRNDSVMSFSWSDIAVTVKDHRTKQPLDILSDVQGFVQAGELICT